MQRGLTLTGIASVIASVAAHGWVTNPISKNELAFHHWVNGMPDMDDFRYEPQTSNHGNGIGQKLETGGSPCGANDAGYLKGLSLWQQFYDKANISVPQIKSGGSIGVHVTFTIDHGGQAWLQLACADHISDSNAWINLERSQNDRSAHFMPSSPGAFAWATLEYGTKRSMYSEYTVPSTFSCASGNVVGRWVWKTCNSCNDFNNLARPTEEFNKTEFLKVVQEHAPGSHWVNQACTAPPEEFISCLDFKIDPGPAPPGPAVSPPPPPPPPPSKPCAKLWKQCGGLDWTGTTCCLSGTACAGTDDYKQCKPTHEQAVDALGAPHSTATQSVNACHDAAKAFCTNGHNYCRACQAYGSWGDMFFVAVCNDAPTTCHSNITAADGTICSCQRKEGCSAGGGTCPYSGNAPGPPSPAPTPSPSPSPSPAPANCAKPWQQCGGSGWTGTTCCVSGATCEGTDAYKQCKTA